MLHGSTNLKRPYKGKLGAISILTFHMYVSYLSSLGDILGDCCMENYFLVNWLCPLSRYSDGEIYTNFWPVSGITSSYSTRIIGVT